MRYEEAMEKYTNGQLPFEELMDMKAELIKSENIECEHSILAHYKRRGILYCGDCGDEIPGAPDGSEDDGC